MFILKSKQKELDRLKWQQSLKQHENMSGKMPYCYYCEFQSDYKCLMSQYTMETQYTCVKAYSKMQQSLTKHKK